jgi:hypothetical protein
MLGRVLPALSAFAATALALLVLTGAGAAATAGGPDLSSPQSIDSYLVSIGVDPATVTHQNGLLNYAGPKCPGKGWSCTTNTRVVQVAAAGGQNRVDCSGESSTEEGQTCVVVQNGDDNSARCVERSTAVTQAQSCSITQTGLKNDALIDQSVDQNDGSTQTVTQDALLTQTGAGGFDRGTIRQSANQSTKTGDSQSQQADQSVKAIQTATGAAANTLNVDQSQNQDATGGSSQQQNSGAPALPDCAPGTPVSSAHTCANISQSSDAGDNDAHLSQTVKEDAKTDAVAVQQQGNFGGGLDSRVHQDTATGKQHNDANQDKRQHAKAAAGSSQTQVDPMFCCGAGSQTGGSNNHESIDQASSQDATDPTAFQESALIGQSLTPNGTCDVKQHASDNVDSTTNSFSVTPCPFVILATECTSVLQEEGGFGCTAFAPIVRPTDTCGIDCLQGPLAFLTRRQG